MVRRNIALQQQKARDEEQIGPGSAELQASRCLTPLERGPSERDLAGDRRSGDEPGTHFLHHGVALHKLVIPVRRARPVRTPVGTTDSSKSPRKAKGSSDT
ncbi:hypothetical protein NDU88_000670 [Pleurodeles waltl]|uniref:Uncharacterized protein n=1 Tax=Pleurodeles waltl TaxID=8319 RepID=A0AAV7NA77_PLEWA|nr:hypothetical protein NDU88_000670 [Pleurodeles waltl]